MKKVSIAIAGAFMLYFAAIGFSSAGGWSVTSLDYLPTNVVANQPLTVGFMIRQHGRTPWVSSGVQVRATPAQGGKTMTVKAMGDQTPGHYTATLTFPQAGTWHWAVASGLFPEWQPMPDLQVQAAPTAAPVTADTIPSTFPLSLSLIAGTLGLVGSSAGLLVWFWRRPVVV
jgi:hypothetical protein